SVYVKCHQGLWPILCYCQVMGRYDCDVVIVEDDPQVADGISDGVRVAGYTVAGVAADGDAALDLVRQRRPRLAIIDVDLGTAESGIQVARRLLEAGPLGIVYITGYPDQVAHADVGHAWMPKPYRLLDLINALKVVDALSQRRPINSPIPPE